MKLRLRTVSILVYILYILQNYILQIFYPLFYYTCTYQKSCKILCTGKMPKKVFDCVKCGGVHERPINSKCKVVVEKDITSTNENVR